MKAFWTEFLYHYSVSELLEMGVIEQMSIGKSPHYNPRMGFVLLGRDGHTVTQFQTKKNGMVEVLTTAPDLDFDTYPADDIILAVFSHAEKPGSKSVYQQNRG